MLSLVYINLHGGIFMSLHESAEMYLETIYQLSKKQTAVRSIDLAEAMGYSKPSISRAVGLLKKGGYLLVDKEGFLSLTNLGLEAAENIFERHTVLTKALIALGVDGQIAAEDACKIEHVISDTTLEAIKNYLERHEI